MREYEAVYITRDGITSRQFFLTFIEAFHCLEIREECGDTADSLVGITMYGHHIRILTRNDIIELFATNL